MQYGGRLISSEKKNDACARPIAILDTLFADYSSYKCHQFCCLPPYLRTPCIVIIVIIIIIIFTPPGSKGSRELKTKVKNVAGWLLVRAIDAE